MDEWCKPAPSVWVLTENGLYRAVYDSVEACKRDRPDLVWNYPDTSDIGEAEGPHDEQYTLMLQRVRR